eukprot:3083864-Pyramimonas_sp.AAC.1
MRSKRIELPEERSRLRAEIAAAGSTAHRGDGSTQFDLVEAKLKLLSRRLQQLRRHQKHTKLEQLVEAVDQAWKHHRFAELHRLRVMLSHAGRELMK